ncbi:MAG: hypothetical protein HY696_08655 [Deltaproteobacteria bacterium]|nr:hypothetical protein [Deltaproteobacteria bacterium]
MLIQWLQKVFSGPTVTAANADKQATSRRSGEARVIDVVRTALRDEATELKHLVSIGLPRTRRRRAKAKVRATVARTIDPLFDDPALIDEVTERIVTAAEVDPTYRALFVDKE